MRRRHAWWEIVYYLVAREGAHMPDASTNSNKCVKCKGGEVPSHKLMHQDHVVTNTHRYNH
jgi:hypothetical protein